MPSRWQLQPVLHLKKISFRKNFRLAWHFGLFQAVMPVLGWSAGLYIRGLIENYDHWVAFALLAFVAQGMLRAAYEKKRVEEKKMTLLGE